MIGYRCLECGESISEGGVGACACSPTSTRRGFHFQRSPTRESPQGKRAIEFGPRIGYWPCLKAPFVQLVFGRWRYDLWFGLPGEKTWRES